MTKILLNGCNGKMGRVICESVKNRKDCEIVAGVDILNEKNFDFPVFTDFDSIDVEADVIIDFSHPSALVPLLTYAVQKKIPAVIATTGLDEEKINLLYNASKEIPVFHSANMSLGVSLISELAQKAAKVLGSGFDIEIIEKHHNQKIDAPSGTALMLADAISSVLDEKPKYVHERQSKREKRTANEIGIHAVRGGTITGEHEIMFAGLDEIVTISHSARSRNIFATGAISAAGFIKNKPAGLYKMSDLVAEEV
ncbi:MAG TPA: 4-hydroxy-tetrahydrodipicolinate reductase [Clostridiales bacterium]|nr:4-hydroxy-tetrahydrodipicolinate reductase [Clostridiales bacterium]